jgi:hypothetical protein
MDFRLYAQVLWRFRVIVLLGLLLASSLALLSVVSVSSSGFKYREAELWSSTTRLSVTQVGFPWGRLYAQEPTTETEELPSAGQEAARLGIPIADPQRFNNLAVLYAQLTTSDPVRRVLRRDGPIKGQIFANALVGGGDIKIQLPLIDLMAVSDSPLAAVMLAQRASNGLRAYLSEQQRAGRVPRSDRVVIEQVVSPTPPRIFRPRSKTMPIVIFLAVMLGTIGLAFLLENVRPRPIEEEERSDAPLHGAAERITA